MKLPEDKVIQIPSMTPNSSTVEQLISNLDERGILVFQVLIGQRSMELLAKKHTDAVTKPSILKPT